MNKNSLNTILYSVLGLIIFSSVVLLFFRIFPYLLVGGAVIWIVIKLIGSFKGNKNTWSEGSYKSTTYTQTGEDTFVEETVDTSNAIDVEFEDVDK